MSKSLRLILGALVIVIIAVLAWFFLLNPIRSDISDTEDAIEEESDLLMTARGKVAQAEATKAEGKRNQARLLELAKMVPASEEVPSLLLQIQDLADQAGIDFITITPGTAVDSQTEEYAILPLDLEFEGSYFAVGDFISRAEQMVGGPGRLLTVKSLELSMLPESEAEAGTSPELQVGMQLYAFLIRESAGGSASPAPGGTTGTTGTSGTTSTTVQSSSN